MKTPEQERLATVDVHQIFGDLLLIPVRRSACGDAARRHVDAQTDGLSPSERAQDHREFNCGLAMIVKAGRFAK